MTNSYSVAEKLLGHVNHVSVNSGSVQQTIPHDDKNDNGKLIINIAAETA